MIVLNVHYFYFDRFVEQKFSACSLSELGGVTDGEFGCNSTWFSLEGVKSDLKGCNVQSMVSLKEKVGQWGHGYDRVWWRQRGLLFAVVMGSRGCTKKSLQQENAFGPVVLSHRYSYVSMWESADKRRLTTQPCCSPKFCRAWNRKSYWQAKIPSGSVSQPYFKDILYFEKWWIALFHYLRFLEAVEQNQLVTKGKLFIFCSTWPSKTHTNTPSLDGSICNHDTLRMLMQMYFVSCREETPSFLCLQWSRHPRTGNLRTSGR